MSYNPTTIKTLSRSIEKLFDVHSAATARLDRRLSSIERALAESRTPAARIKAGIRAGAASAKNESFHEYGKALNDPAFAAAFFASRRQHQLAIKRTRTL